MAEWNEEKLDRIEKLLEAVADHLMPNIFGYLVTSRGAADTILCILPLPNRTIPEINDGDSLLINAGMNPCEVVRVRHVHQAENTQIDVTRSADPNTPAVAHLAGAYIQLLRQRP